MICTVAFFCAAAVIAAPAQSVFFTDLANFDYTNGANPTAGLVQGTDGNFYGTTPYGGTGNGTVFKITPSGTLTTLYDFAGSDGAIPFSGVLQASDGNFYGTTWGGGTNCAPYGCGTVFKVTPEGVLTTLHSFDDNDGANPYGGLVQATDGNFYGTTWIGGFNNNGTVFKITSTGTLTTLHRFNGFSDGTNPVGLMQATDGNFYGIAAETNSGYYSTIFKMTPGGVLTILYTFCQQPNCADGSSPNGLIQASDGNFYATTYGGGANCCYGTVFKMTLAGSLTTLYSFCSQPNCADGGNPLGRLLQSSDGNLYGTTSSTPSNQCTHCGTVFKITLTGGLTTLHTFDWTHGLQPEAGVIQATDGNFYGTTWGGGNLNACTIDGCGTVFRLGLVRICATCRP